EGPHRPRQEIAPRDRLADGRVHAEQRLRDGHHPPAARQETARLAGLEPPPAVPRFPIMGRISRFWNELMLLWRAFRAPETPLWLKALMLLVPGYLLFPLDIIPDFIPIVGWLDDAVIIPLLVSLLVRLVPQ